MWPGYLYAEAMHVYCHDVLPQTLVGKHDAVAPHGFNALALDFFINSLKDKLTKRRKRVRTRHGSISWIKCNDQNNH